MHSLIPVSNKEEDQDVLWHEVDILKDLINKKRIIPDAMRATYVLNNKAFFFSNTEIG